MSFFPDIRVVNIKTHKEKYDDELQLLLFIHFPTIFHTRTAKPKDEIHLCYVPTV